MELFTAIEWGHVEEISSLLKNKVSFVKKDKNRFTPLLLAARRLGQVYREVYNAKKKRYGEKLGEGEQMSALHFSCCARDRNFVRRLLIRGADINERILESCPLWPGYTPLQLCIELEFEDIARMLLCRGADLSIVSPNGCTPIFMAEKKKLLDLTSTMLSMYKSWTVNPVDKESGESYLHLACKHGLVNVVKALLLHGADANLQIECNGYTPLHVAKDASVVKVLLRYGANLCIKDHTDETPLHRAFYEEKNGALEAMFEGHGQCRANPVNRHGCSHLHIACLRGFNDAVKGILEHNVVDINARVISMTIAGAESLPGLQCNGWTPLHLAAVLNEKDDPSISQMLLDAGADVNAKGDQFNFRPLHLAVRFNRTNHVALLLKQGADCNAIGTGIVAWSALHEACRRLQVENVRLLLEHGANPNEKVESFFNFTPLHLCAVSLLKNTNLHVDNRHSPIIRYLVEAGANMYAHDDKKAVPLDQASANSLEHPLRAFLFYNNIDEKKTYVHIKYRKNKGFSIEMLLKHLEVLRHANPSNVTGDDSDLLKEIYASGLHSEDEVTSIRNACRKEIEVLREMGLDICLTYSKIFTKNAIGVDRLWRRSEKLVELVESNELHQFPMYGGRLRQWYGDLQRVPSCLARALVVAKKHWNLDRDSAEAIFCYLNHKELETMVKAFEFS